MNEKTSLKTSSKTPIIFFGSGPVAANSLALIKDAFEIEAVITKPTTQKEMQQVTPDKQVFTVSNKAELDNLFAEQKFESVVGVLIDFGIIVSQKIIEYFPRGIVNSHFSLLPELRGADPISFAILESKKKTGVSLMLLVEAMDEGPIIAIGMFDLDQTETTPSLTDELIYLSHELLVENIPKYLSDEIKPADQEVIANKFNLTPSYSKKLKKSDGIIDWSKSATEIEREIRAYSGWPNSRTSFSDFDCTITKVAILNDSGIPGQLYVHEKALAVYCGEGSLLIDSLKPAGKKEMNSQAFLAGYKSKLNI